MEVRRINPEGGIVREIKELRKRASSLETRPAGNIVIRETLTTTDPATGVSTTIGQLPDGSYGFQPFIGDLVPPPVATTPLVSVAPGIFTVSWDGSFVAGAEKPRDFQHVNVIGHKIVNGATTLSLEVGVIRLPSESVIVTPDVAAVGETWEFSLASEDYNGNVAVRGTRSAPVTMPSVVTDQGVNDALAQVNQQVVSAQSAAASAQNAADTAQRAADDAAQAVVDLGSIKGAIYTQSATPSADPNGLWIDTGHNNIPRRYLGKTGKALVSNLGGGSSVSTRLSALGWSVSAISTTPTFAQASSYDVVAFDAGYAGLSSSIDTLATQLLDRGVSVYTSGNDTTALPYLFSGSASRGTPKNPIRPVGTHPAAQGWAQYSDNDLNFYLTGVNSAATVTGVTLVGSVDQPLNVVREHATSFARWAHIETYASPAAVIDAHLNWMADNWVAVQDQGIISASSAAASAQNKADQAFNNAATAASAAGTAQSTADGKNTNWYQPDQPAGTGHKVGDTWFDTDDGYKLRTWNGSVWQTTQDSALAKQIADSKALVYTQPTTPPLEARVASTIWNDTSLGLNNIVVKHWNGTAWTALVDKATTDAAAVADSKGETIYSTTEPAVAKRLPQNLWVDTTGGINIHKRWDGNAWVVAADSRIASNATAVTAAQATADSKSVVYTQSFTPPVEARLPQTLWNDTSLGLDKIVVKYWNGSDWTSLADKAATDASTSASTAMAAQSYSTNASFDDWTGTYPTGYTFWNSTPVKETTIVRRAPNAIRFNVADTTVQSGVAYASILSHAPNLEYFTVELDFYLVSGGLGQAGMILDWGGLTNNRAQINLFDEVPSPATGKWYRVVKTLRRPTNATGTFTSMNGYLMGQWSGHTGGGAAKNIIFDWFNIRPSSAEEILAFNSTTVAQTKADAAQAAAITAAQATTMLATAYSKNPSFDDWASTLPDTYSVFGAITPTKDTTNKRIGAHGLKFTVPGTEDAGINFVNNVSHMPNVEYITVELEFMLTSGTLAGAGVLIDWNGLTPIRSLVKLTDHVLTPVTGKWYRISAVVARPANATGTWTSMGGWLMANWNELGTKVAKTITYDWLNVRPSTAEEITAYKAPAKYTELSGATTTAQQSADGKNKVHYSTSAASGTTDPTDNNRPFVEGDTWYQRDATTPSKIIAQWEFTGGAWVSRKITGLVLTEVDAGTITVGYLRGENLSATAIDGKTITGALIQTDNTPIGTAASRGIKLTTAELMGYDTAGNKTFSLSSAGVLTMKGKISSGSEIEGATITGTTGLQTHAGLTAGVKVTNAGIKAWDGSNNLTFHLDATTGYLEVPGLKANSIAGDKIVTGSISVDKLLVAGSNLHTDAGFRDTSGWSLDTGVTLATTGGRTGGGLITIPGSSSQIGAYYARDYPTKRTPVKSSGSYRVTAWVKSVSAIPVGGVSVYVRAYNPDNTMVFATPNNRTNTAIIPANTWTEIGGLFQIPAGYTQGVWGTYKEPSFTTAVTFSDIFVQEATSGELIVDGSIDGKTITGALIQTDNTPVGTSASRGIKLTSTELAGYDTAGLKNFSLTSAGALTIVGAIQSGGTISGTQVTGSLGLQTSTSATAGVKMNNTGIKAWDGSNNLTFHLDATTGYLELPGLKANSIKGDRLEAGSVGTDRLVVGDMTNFVLDPFMTGSGKIAGATYLVSSATAAVSASAPFERVAKLTARDSVENPAQMRPMTPGEVFYAEAWVRAEAAANKNIYLGLWIQSSDGTNNWNTTNTTTGYTSFATPAQGQTGWVKLQGTFTVPTTVASGKPVVQGRAWVQIAGTTGAETAGWYLTGWNMRRQADVTTIADGVITTKKIVTSGLDGAVITAGTLTAVQMKGKSITVDKLVVSSTDNLIVEADFGNGGASWGTLNANKAIVATAGRGSLPALRVTGSTALQTLDNLVNRVTVGTEDRFRGSMYVKSSVAAASGVAKLRMKAYTTATAFTSLTVATSQALTAGAWTLVEGYSPALPANTIAIEFFLEVQNAATGTTLDIDYVGMTRAADGKLVIDGAIDGKTITGALFQTDNSPLDSTASRGIKLNSSGLKAYSPTGVKTFGIDALTGEVSSSGTFATTSSEYVEGSGTMTIGAIFGNLTYNSHTEYSGIPGIKFTRTHSSEGVKPPASILYDGNSINLSTYPDDNGFTPNTAGSHIGVGEGNVTMGASRNGAIAGETIPSPQLELHGGTVAGPGYEHIDVMMSSKPSTDYMKVGLQIDNTREYGAYSQANPFAVSLVNYSDQYQPQKKGKTVISARDGGKWLIEGSRHSDGTTISSLSADASGNLWMGATESFRIGNFASNLNEIVISPGPGIVMKGQTKIVGDLTMDTNSGQWGGSINAASYKLNGVDLSAGEVQSWNLSGTIGNGMIPVVKLSGFQADTTTSTVSGLGTAGTDTITITNAGVYNIHLSYGQNAGATSDRNFIEIGASNQDKLLARAAFATGEDSVSVTASGVLLEAGTTLRFEALQYSGGTRNYVARVRLVRVAAPVPVTSWGTGDISQSGNVTVAGDIFSKPRFARFVSDNFTIAGNNTPWDSGPVTEVTSVSKNNNFVVPGPFAGSIKFTQSGWYQVSHFMRGRSATGASWSRLFLGSTGELLVQVSNGNGQIWEQYLSTVPIYVAANDYIRCSVVAATQHAADTTWNVVRFPWSVT